MALKPYNLDFLNDDVHFPPIPKTAPPMNNHATGLPNLSALSLLETPKKDTITPHPVNTGSSGRAGQAQGMPGNQTSQELNVWESNVWGIKRLGFPTSENQMSGNHTLMNDVSRNQSSGNQMFGNLIGNQTSSNRGLSCWFMIFAICVK